MYSIQKKRKRRFIKSRSGISIILLVILITGQFFTLSTVLAETAPVSSATADGWENYNYFNFAEAL